MKADHFYVRPPGHVKGRVGCSTCGLHVVAHPSKLEADFDAQVARARLDAGMVREHPFASGIGRRWRFDRAWPAYRIAVELDGGVRMAHGRHTTQRDRDRDNYAGLMGWLVLAFEPRHLESGLAVEQLAVAVGLGALPASGREAARGAISAALFPPPSQR